MLVCGGVGAIGVSLTYSASTQLLRASTRKYEFRNASAEQTKHIIGTNPQSAERASEIRSFLLPSASLLRSVTDSSGVDGADTAPSTVFLFGTLPAEPIGEKHGTRKLQA